MNEQLLLVEDDEAIRESLVDIIEAEGYRVITARNGHQALSLIERASAAPDLILLDLTMPVMDGLEFLTQLRALPDAEKSQIQVIVLTASRERPSGPGIVASLRKPIDIDGLLRTVSGALERK